MAARFEELAWADTRMGELTLRRRTDRQLDREVYEVKLGDEYLMSSLFTVAEIELARLGLAELFATSDVASARVLVGGLGLGYTALAVLEHAAVSRLDVVEALPDVIDWHRRELLPASPALMADARTNLVDGDFFAMMAAPRESEDLVRYDAMLVDIDHTPSHQLDPSHAAFYEVEGLRRLGGWLEPGGVFALWSDDPPDAAFEQRLAAVFAHHVSRVVAFDNPLTGGQSANTVYVARDLIDLGEQG